MKPFLPLLFMVVAFALCLNASGQPATVTPHSLPSTDPKPAPTVQPAPAVPNPNPPITPVPANQLTPTTNAPASGPPNIMAPSPATNPNPPGSPGR